MSSVPMPRDLSEEAVAEWVTRVYFGDAVGGPDEGDRAIARAVRALVEREVAKERASTREKVREAIEACAVDCGEWADVYGDRGDVVRCGVYRNASLSIRNEADEIVARVLGDPPSNASGGHDEGRPAREEAPRG